MSSSLTNPCGGLWSSPSHWEEAFQAAVLSRYEERRCCLCDAPPEVIETAHIVPVSDDGSDWGGNGLLLCRNHHALYDLGKWCLNPEQLEVVPASGQDLSTLQVNRSNVRHLKQGPDRLADLTPDALLRRKVRITQIAKRLEQERHAIDAVLLSTFGDAELRFGVRAPGGWVLKQRSRTSWEYDSEVRDAIKGLQGQAQRDGRAQSLVSTYLCLTQET